MKVNDLKKRQMDTVLDTLKTLETIEDPAEKAGLVSWVGEFWLQQTRSLYAYVQSSPAVRTQVKEGLVKNLETIKKNVK